MRNTRRQMKPSGWMLAILLATTAPLLGQEGLVISELLYQPRPGEAEYVELYNSGASALELSNYHIVRWTGDTLGQHYELPRHTVAAYGYVVLTKNAASVVAGYEVKDVSNIVECSLPTYPNTGGSVIVCRADGTVEDRLDYLPSMHSRLLRNKAGVSLERRWMNHQSDEVGNWFSASSVSGYGTPGYRNSQSMEVLAEEAGFEFPSAVVSPDGDGIDDELRIDYTLPDEEPLMGRAEVYDLRGRRVRRLLNGDVMGSHGTVVWDGRDDGGQWLAQGQYVVLLTLYNLTGTQQTIKRAVAYLLP